VVGERRQRHASGLRPGSGQPAAGQRAVGQRAHGVSQRPAADVTLGDDVLDRIHELVAPGVTLNPEDNSYGTAELMASARRR